MSSFMSLSVQPSTVGASAGGMQPPLAPTQPVRPRMPLRHEVSWRSMPQEHADDTSTRASMQNERPVVLARWTTCDQGKGAATGPHGYYVVALALRPTLLRLSSN